MMKTETNQPHIVIIGGGFGGLYTAKALRNDAVKITLVDQHNYHLFQPLLYQVATGGLSPADIASPLRAVLKRQKNTTVLKAKVVDIDPTAKRVIFDDGQLDYDILVVATGVQTSYFGHDEWAEHAPGLKGLHDALEIRERIFHAYEAAERETDPELRKAWMTFVVIGGGPTGVEMAGAISELALTTLKNDFRAIDPTDTQIFLLEGAERVLPPYLPELSTKAEKALTRKGTTIRTKTLVTDIQGDVVTLRHDDKSEQIRAKTVVWAAGMRATPIAKILHDQTGAKLDRMGRVIVEPDLSIANHPNIFVIGDLAHFAHQDGKPLPGVAPVAMQQGAYTAQRIRADLTGNASQPFQYFDKGSLAVIGRNAAVAQVAGFKLSGFVAWLIWIFVHIAYLIEYDNRIVVLFQWAINYITRKRGARLIVRRVQSSRSETITRQAQGA